MGFTYNSIGVHSKLGVTYRFEIRFADRGYQT